MTTITEHMTYAAKLKVLEGAVTPDTAKSKKARKQYRALVKPKSQMDFLNEVRVIAGSPEWNDLADAIGIKRRAFTNYRLPEHSGNYRSMNDATLRQVFAYLNLILAGEEPKAFDTNVEKITQKELFNIIKDLVGNPMWKDLSEAVCIKHVTLLNYILPEDSKNYRSIPPAALKELVELKDKLLSLTEEGKSEEELWEMIKDGAFEKPDMNIDLTEHLLKKKWQFGNI